MKKIFLLTILVTGFSSCSNYSDSNELNVSNNVNNTSYLRSYEDALNIANNVVFDNEKGDNTRSVVQRHKVKDYTIYTPYSQTRSCADADVSFYIINYDDNKGFAMISTDKRATPVYAYSDTGNIDINQVVENAGWDDFIEAATDYYKLELKVDTTSLVPTDKDPVKIYGDAAAAITQVINGVECKVTTSLLNPQYKGSVLSTKWAQRSPYNYYYPQDGNLVYTYNGKTATGCVPVALGQIMAYYRHPVSYNGYVYNWNEISSKPEYDKDEFTTASLNTAHLIHDIAIAGDAVIGNGASMYFSGALQVMDKFEYKYKYSNFNYDNLKQSIERNRPVFVVGWDENNNEKGHAWIVDGIKEMSEYKIYHRPNPPYEVFNTEPTGNTVCYYHCNWGWGGKDDAYCLNVFIPNNKWTLSHNPRIIYDIQKK